MRMTFSEPPKRSKPRRAANISLPADLIEEAKGLDINISKACQQGLEQQVATSRAEAWLKENRAALEAWNDWVRENGLPYAEYRPF